MKGVPSGIENGTFPLESELAWQREAACRGLGTTESQAMFFPTKGESIKEAKAICAGCPVVGECLDFALTNGCIGVWGGTSERERRQMRVRRRLSAPQLLGSR